MNDLIHLASVKRWNIVYCRTLTLYHDKVKMEIDYATVRESGQLQYYSEFRWFATGIIWTGANVL